MEMPKIGLNVTEGKLWFYCSLRNVLDVKMYFENSPKS